MAKAVLHTTNGFPIITNREIEELRAMDKETPNPFNVITQTGGQEKLLLTDADITIYGGCRGGGKSFGILLEALRDIYNPKFKAVILRREKNDLSDMIETSRGIFSSMGEYNKSKDDMTWNFHKGGTLKFDYFAGAYEDFYNRYQGKQFAYIAVDEITHMPYRNFKALAKTNRNASFIRNRFIGSCNPDYYSWVYKFIRQWLDDEGKPIPEMDGKVRYCYLTGENVEDIVWGETRDEVYNKCKKEIDSYYTPDLEIYGKPQDLFINSVCFIEGVLRENTQLLRSDPTYLAKLVGQSKYDVDRDYFGVWRPRTNGDDIIKPHHVEEFYNNSIQLGDGRLRVSCDVAFSGGDNLVMWLWRGWHIEDVYAVRNIDSRLALEQIKFHIKAWGVKEEDFTYDVSGLGQGVKGFFPKALPFNNRETPIDVPKGTYDSIKSQCAFVFADKMIRKEISINSDLLDRKFSGTGYESMTLREILHRECKTIRPDSDREASGRCLIKKPMMKRMIGHSPDFIESLYMRVIFDLKRKKIFKGLGWL